MANNQEIEKVINSKYKFGFSTELEIDRPQKGVS